MPQQKHDVTRVVLVERPFPINPKQIWYFRGHWPAQWVALPGPPRPPFVSAYRLKLQLTEPHSVLTHVSADERYELWVDGQRVGQGPERGDLNNWCFESYQLDLGPGEHIIAARVWSQGDQAPYAQHSLRPSFLFVSDDVAHQDQLTTGHAKWEAKILPGYTALDHLAAWGTGAKLQIDGRDFDWDWLKAGEGNWAPVANVEIASANVGTNDNEPRHLLVPAMLPAMYDELFTGGTVRHVVAHGDGPTSPTPIHAAENLTQEQAHWNALLAGTALTIPPNTTRRVILDLENYLCAYPELTLSGGRDAIVRVHWQEALFEGEKSVEKGNRGEIEGKYFTTVWNWADGVGDTFIADGGPSRFYSTLWFEAGRYVELLVKTKDAPLTIERLGFRETRYPFSLQSHFRSSDPRLERVIPIAYRTLQMCTHETFFDCPFYEQLQYVGDSRLQVLVCYVTSDDDRLPRKMLKTMDVSRYTSGLTHSRYPSRVRQVIPPFSLWWIAMIHDFMLWRGDKAFVRDLMPGVRTVLDAHRRTIDEEGLLQPPDGWNYMDWVPEWPNGIPPNGEYEASGVLNLLLALAARYAADLERWMDEPELAARQERLAERTVAAATKAFYDEKRGLYADDLAKSKFSEHAQCLALLEGTAPHRDRVAKGLVSDTDLSRTTIFFSHYLFETYYQLGRTDLMLDRMPLWFDHHKNGLTTLIEKPEPTRSDCHAWGAHPIYHFFASILGIRPTSPGMKTVRVKPLLGPLAYAHGQIPTPLGTLKVGVDGANHTVDLPPGMRLDAK